MNTVVTYWAPASNGGFAPPVLIHTNYKPTVLKDEVTLELDKDVVPGGYLCLGNASSILDPRWIYRVMKVKSCMRLPDLRRLMQRRLVELVEPEAEVKAEAEKQSKERVA